MNHIVDKLLEILRRLNYLGLQYFYVGFSYVIRFFKIQVQRWKKRGAQKQLETTFGGLGAEIYSLHKQSETDWQGMPSVQQQLRQVEEAESKVFHVDSVVEEIKNDFLNRKEELREKYSAKMANAKKPTPEEPEA